MMLCEPGYFNNYRSRETGQWQVMSYVRTPVLTHLGQIAKLRP